MTKYKLYINFFISLSVLKIIEAGRIMSEASEEPVKLETITQEFTKNYELGINSDENLSRESDILYVIMRRNETKQNTDAFLNTFYNSMQRIDEIYMSSDQFLNNDTRTNVTAMEDYFKLILDDTNNGIVHPLEVIRRSTTTIINLFDNIVPHNTVKKFKGGQSLHCGNKPILRQQHILNLFKVILDRSYKGHYLIIAAHKFLARLKNETRDELIQSALTKSREELEIYAEGATAAFWETKKKIYACDDDTEIKHKTYVEINGPSQGFIFDSSEVNPRDTCTSFDDERDRCDNRSETCFQHTCTTSGGILKNCKTISKQTLKICPATDATKKYLSAESETKKYGNLTAAQHCPKAYKERRVTQVEISMRFLSDESVWEPNFFCYCSCQRAKWQPGDVRAISLEWTVTDFSSNKVLTGLKFEEKNGMILLRAQQGVILPGAMIDQATLSWVETLYPEPSQNYNGIPTYRYPKSETHILSGLTLKNNEDFIYMRDDLSINIDYIEVPKNHVVVGVKLKKSESKDDENQNVLELVVWSVYYDIDTGKLNQERSEKISTPKFLPDEFLNDEYKYSKREMLYMHGLGNPISKDVKNNKHSHTNVKVEFTETDMEEDLGQSIVPFIDIRPITTTPAIPIAGVSLDYRGSYVSGGFLGFQLHSYDINEYFRKIIQNYSIEKNSSSLRRL